MFSGKERISRIKLPKLELLLGLASLALLLQAFPSLWGVVWQALDARHWSRPIWIILNVAFLIALFGLRFGPDAIADLRERRKRLGKERSGETVSSAVDADLESRRRRDAEWVQRAKKRLPWQ